MNGCALGVQRRSPVQRRGELVATVLRLAEMIRQRHKPGRTRLHQIALLIMTETECSKATAYRWAGEFVDALGLELSTESSTARELASRRSPIAEPSHVR